MPAASSGSSGRTLHGRTRSSSTSASPFRSGSSRIGGGSPRLAEAVDPDRSADRARSRGRCRGSGSRATWTWRSRSACVRAKNSDQWRCARLVGADLGGDDRLVERHPDPRLRRADEIAVGVREDRELPAACLRLLERGRHLGKRLPRRQRARRAHRAPRQARRAARATRAMHLAVWELRVGRLDLAARPRGSARAARRRCPRRRSARARGGSRRSSRSASRSSRTSPSGQT